MIVWLNFFKFLSTNELRFDFKTKLKTKIIFVYFKFKQIVSNLNAFNFYFNKRSFITMQLKSQ